MGLFSKKWEEDPQSATGTRKTSHILSLVSTVVCPTPNSVSTMVEGRNRTGTCSPTASILSQRRRNRSHPNVYKPLVLLPTNTWLLELVKKVSASVLEFTPGTSSASTRCFPAPVLIDFRPVCATPTERPSASVLVSTSEPSLSPSERNPRVSITPRKPSEEPNLRLPAVRWSSSPESSDSPSTLCLTSSA